MLRPPLYENHSTIMTDSTDSTESTQPAQSTTEQRDNEQLTGTYDSSLESKWQHHWTERGTYTTEYETEPANTRFTIDTPPPTVSGDLHIGHLYQFTLQDFAARFHRMRDDAVFFPLGSDDNGIASERLTEQELGIRHQDFTRQEFQKKCREVCTEYETDFAENVRSLGISIDWTNTYTTIEPRVQRVSQLSFIELYEQGREYRQEAPSIWCPDCETAISQMETETAERDSFDNDITFPFADRQGFVTISTTRPELLPACVAVFVHPGDEEYAFLAGERVTVPLFGHSVPILEDERVDTGTGTGVVMCCTFGDRTDIEWYHAHDLPLRVAIDATGTMTEIAGPYAGMSTTEARERIVMDLDEQGYLTDSQPITHSVHVHDRCEMDIEFRVTEQWYVSVLDRAEAYLEAGLELDWYPETMRTRYRNWIDGLEWDWCISRQRDSGIPFPVWYCANCGHAILADRDQLPVDPLTDEPPVDSCPQCGHDTLTPEEDVFDTWATSSLTPLINSGWDWDESEGELTFEHPERYPMTLRPQGHDIISTWLFHTIVKCHEHTGEIPFESVILNGMVLDENHEAMSSSRGNIIAPETVLDSYPVDAARYWAAGASIGDDFPFTEGDLEAGERLLRKLWNASKLVEQLTSDESLTEEPNELSEIDRWLLTRLDETVTSATDRMAEYEFSKARDELRSFFWHTVCDNYLEIAKQRDDTSTAYTLRRTHRTVLKLFAPFLPHITEEIWQRCYGTIEARDESIHTSDWPEPRGYEADNTAGETAMEIVSALRRYKTENGFSLNTPLDHVEVYGRIDGFESAISGVMHVRELTVLDEMPGTSEVVGIELEYETLGPRYGEQLDEIEAGAFAYDGETLTAAGVALESESFEIELERTFSGDGTMIETELVTVIVR
jgi:valyl-tRNA synthetase